VLQSCAESGEQAGVGGADGERAGLQVRDEVGAVGVDSDQLCGGCHGEDAVGAGDHCRGGVWEGYLAALDASAVGDREQVGAQLVDAGDEVGLA